MGIKELGKFVREEGIKCQFELELTYFSGTAFGIDTLNWIYRQVPIVTKTILDKKANIFEPITDDEVYLGVKKRMYDFNKRLIDHNITPVWIWDGVSQDNKVLTQEDRRQKRKEARLKRDALFEELSAKDILELTDQEIKKWRNSVGNTTGISRSGTKKLKEFTEQLGIPTITSDDEAENLASSLSVEGKVSVVWSNDTDNYPLGADKVACEFSYRKGKIYIKGIEPRKIPPHLGWDFRTFRDFCILMGTDFNKRIKGMGPKTCRKLIDRYKTIETVDQETKHNFTFHNYKNVRKQLTPYSTYYQLDYHFKVKRCYCPDKIEELEKSHPDVNIRKMITSINQVHFKGTVVSPMPETPVTPRPRRSSIKENEEKKGSDQFLEEQVRVVDDDESSQEGSPQMKSVGE